MDDVQLCTHACTDRGSTTVWAIASSASSLIAVMEIEPVAMAILARRCRESIRALTRYASVYHGISSSSLPPS